MCCNQYLYMDNFKRGLHSFLLPVPKCTKCIKQVLMPELIRQAPKLVLALAPQVRMYSSSKVVHGLYIILFNLESNEILSLAINFLQT
jgi:hypothetical protein